MFVADELKFKISYSGRTMPTLTDYPPFPRFIGRKWKLRRADLGLFWIQLRALPTAGGSKKNIFVA